MCSSSMCAINIKQSLEPVQSFSKILLSVTNALVGIKGPPQIKSCPLLNFLGENDGIICKEFHLEASSELW